MELRLRLLCLFLLTGITCSVFAVPGITVRGNVKDQQTKEALIGVAVQVQGTTMGTVTDLDGNFKLSDVQKGATLLFSYIGMKSETRIVKDASEMNVQLEADAMGLEEVVVVGYGTSRKRDLTGSIVSISGDELKNTPDYNPIRGLQGKVPGLTVVNSGSAGGAPSIRLRGVATIQSSTDPLYVVDGMLMDNIDFISPNDIVSIEVLKDPSSLAIFGVQGANGVIILTTSRAEKGKITATYDGYAGVQYLHNRDRVKLTNASDFTTLYNELLQNMATSEKPYKEFVPDLLGKGTDWLSIGVRPAAVTNHSVTISSASDRSSSVLSLGYFYQDGILKYENYNRYNLRYSGDYNITKNVKVGSNMNLSRWSKENSTANLWEMVRSAPTYSPYAPSEDYNPENLGSVYNPSPDFQKQLANPLANMEIHKGMGENYGYRGVGSAYLEINFLKDFQFKATGYADLGVSMTSQANPKYFVGTDMNSSMQKRETNNFSRSSAEYTKYQADFILSYNKKIKRHSIGATVGYTARLKEEHGFSASADTIAGKAVNVVPNDLWMLGQGSPKNKGADDWYGAESFISYLARVNYAYADRYLLTATFRADGSSKFSPNKRWGYFPSVGTGWIISEESFMKDYQKEVNFLKLKASWGQLGNDKIGNYLWFPTINPTGQQVIIDGVIHYIPTVSNLVDKNIHWEVMEGFDVGVEGRFLDHRLGVDLGYFTKTTRDLLAHVTPSASVGAGFEITNAGSIRNSGFEFLASWRDQIGDFSYGASVNGATLKNVVLALGDNNKDIITGDTHRTSVGHSVGSFYGYVQDGIFQNQAEVDAYKSKYTVAWNVQPGDIRYKDLNNDNRVDDKDRDFIGSPFPSFTYGMNLNAGYKGFDLSIDFNGVAGNKILNTKYRPGFTQYNFYQSQMDRWHGEGTSNTMPILDYGRGHNNMISTNMLEDGSYFRLRAVQLGYTLPKTLLKQMKLSKLRFFVNVQNPLTFKKNTGFTPEVGGGILDGGVDSGGTYPLPTTYTAGLTLTL